MLADISLSNFSDATVYLVMGIIGTLLFTIRVSMMLIFGMHGGGDFDMHADAGGAGHGSGFGLFSLLSIIAFMMGAGWVGLAARTDWHLGQVQAAFAACGFGFTLMFLSSLTMWQMKKFNVEGKYDVQATVGRTGRVYLAIPAKGEGTGQVEMNVDGRRAILTAKSSSKRIDSFTTVKVLEVQDSEIVLVEPI